LGRLAPTVARIEQRKMFGYPALFLTAICWPASSATGWCCAFPSRSGTRSSPPARPCRFVAMGGRVLREWVFINEPERIADTVLGELLEAARLHTAAMPPKAKKAALRTA
jgi:hypothetical protein